MNEALLSLGQVLAVGETTATVRVWLAAGGVVEVALPALGLTLLAVGATVVVGFTGEGPESGVVLGAVAGASLAAVQGHGHDDRYYTEGETDTLLAGKAAAAHGHADLVPWSQFDGAVVDLVGDYLVDSATVGWAVGGGGMQATVLGVRVMTESERDALGAGDGVVIFNSTSGAFEGRAGGVWVGLG